MHFIEDHFIPGEGHNLSAQTTAIPDGQITCHQKNRNGNRLKGRLPVHTVANSDIPMSLACYLELCEKRNPADHTHDAEQQLTAEPVHASALAASTDLRPRCSQPKANARTTTSSKTSKNLKGSQSKSMTKPKQKATTKAKAKDKSPSRSQAQAMVHGHANASANAEAQDYVTSTVTSSGIPSGCASCCESGGYKDRSGSAEHASSQAPNSLSGRKARKPHSCSNASKTRSGSKAKTRLHSSSKPNGPKATAIPSDVQEKAIAMLLALAKEPAPAQSCISAQTVSGEDCLLACSNGCDDSATASRNSCDSSVGASIDCGGGPSPESRSNDGLDDSCDGVAGAEHDHLNDYDDNGHHPYASMQQDAHDADIHEHGHEHGPEHKQAQVHGHAESTSLEQAQDEKQICSAAQVNSSSDSISVDDDSDNISVDAGGNSSDESADCAEHESRLDESITDEAAQPSADADKSEDKSSLVDGTACSDAPGEAQGGARGKYLTYEQHLASDQGRPNYTRKIFKGSERAVADSLYSLDIDSLMIHRSLQHLELAVDALEDGTASESELKMAGSCGTLARVLMEHCDHLASWPELSEALYQLLSDRSVLNAASFESSGDLARLCELAPGPEWPRHSGAAASSASDASDSDDCSTAARYALSNLHSMADLGVETSDYLETMLTRILTARHLPERRALFETLLHEINTRQSRNELKTNNYHPESGQPLAKASGGSSCGTADRSGSSKLRNGTDADDCGGIVEAGVDTDSTLADQSGNAEPKQSAPARGKRPARLPDSCDDDLINDDHAHSTADDAVGLADNASDASVGLADKASDDGSSNEADAYSQPDADAGCAAACTAAALAGSGSGQHSSQRFQGNAPAGVLYKSFLCNEGNIASLGDELCAQQDELSTDAGSSSCTDSQNARAVTREQVKQAGACNETDKTTQTADSHSTVSNTGRTGSDGHERSECSSVSSQTSKTKGKRKCQKHGKGQDHDHADSETERPLKGNSVSEIEVDGEVEIEGKSCCSQGNDSAHVSGSSSTACTDTDCAAGADSGYSCNEGSDSECGSAIASSKGTFWWDEIIGDRLDRHRTRHSAESSVDSGAGAAGKAERCSARAAGLIDDARDEQLIISSLIRAFNSSLGTEGGPHDKRARKVYKSALEEATLATCDVVHLNGVFSQPDNALECMLRACTASLSARRADTARTGYLVPGGAARKGVRRPGAVTAAALAATTVPDDAEADAKAHTQDRSLATREIESTGTSGAISASSEAQSSSSASASSSASTAPEHASVINAQAACSESMIAHAGLTCSNDTELSYYPESRSHDHNDGVAAAADSDESRHPSQALDTSRPAGLNHLAEGKCLTSRTFWQTIKSRKSRSRSRTGAYSHAQLSGSMTEAANGSSHVAAAPDGCACSAATAASGCAAGHGFDGNEAGTCAGPDAGLGTGTAKRPGTWKSDGSDYADSQATGVHRLKSQHASTQPADACGCSSVAADSRKAGRTSSHGRPDTRELQMLALALSMKGMTSEEVSYFLPRLACELPCGHVQHSWSGQVIHSADAHNKAWSHETAGYGSGTGTGGGADAAADATAWADGGSMRMGMDSSMLRKLLADNTISGQRRSMSAELTHPVSKMALDNMIRLYFAFHRDQGLLYSERYVLSCEGGESERMQSLIFADSFRRAGGLAMASIIHENGHITVTLNTVSATDDLPDLQVQAPQHSSTACTTEHDTDRQSKNHDRTRGKSATSSTSNSHCNINGGQDHAAKDTDTGNSTGTGSDAASATDYATASDTKAASAKACANAPSIASASSPDPDERSGVSCEQSTDTDRHDAGADSCCEAVPHDGSDGTGSDSGAETVADTSADAGSNAASGPEGVIQDSSDSTGPDSGAATWFDSGADYDAGTGSNAAANVAADASTGADNGPDAVTGAGAAKGSADVAQPATDADDVPSTEACSDADAVTDAGDASKATHDAVSTSACATAEGYADQVKTSHAANETETAAESGDAALTAAVDTDAAASSTVSKSTGKRGRKAKSQSSASSKNKDPADRTAEDSMAAGHADSRSDQCQSSVAECGSGSESCCEPSIKTSSAGKDAKSGRGHSHSHGHGNGNGHAGLGGDDGQHQGGRFSEGLEELIEVLNVATVDGHRMGLYSLADYRRRPAMRALYDYLCSCEYDEHAASNMGSWDWNGGRQSYGGCDRYRDLNRLDLLSMLSARSALSRDGDPGSSGGPAGGLAALAAGIAPKGRTPAVKWLPLCVHALVSHKKLKSSAVSAQSRLNALRSQQTRDRERGHCGAINIPWALAVHDMYCHLADSDASDERNAPKGSLIPGADDNEKMGIFRRYRLPQIAVLLRCLDQLRHGHAFMFRCSCGHETFICDGAYNRLSGTEQICPFCGSAISFTS